MSSEVREPSPPKPRATVGGVTVKVEDEVVRSETGGGWTATEVLVAEGSVSSDAAAAGGMTAAEAVREDRAERGARDPKHPDGVRLTALGQPFAIFHHPSEFTEAEDAVIVNGLMASLPLYMIAAKLNCSRNLLSKHIKESKLLSEVWVDAQESFIDNVEWQAKRLIDSGNAAMIMFALERKGKDRGWGQKDEQEVELDDSRIIIGEIPEAEVEAADAKVKELEKAAGVDGASSPEGSAQVAGAAGSAVDREHAPAVPASAPTPSQAPAPQKLPSPMEMALMEEAAKAAAKAVRDEGTISIPPEDVQVEPAPWDDGYGGGDPFGGGMDGGFGGGMDGGFGGFM